MNIFQTEVLSIGSDAEDFKAEGMIILFGEEAPEELMDFCHIIQVSPAKEQIVPGMEILFGEERYPITAVGDAAEENLNTLGHISITFDGASTAEMPGSLYVEAKSLPQVGIGDRITIIRGK